MEMERSGKFLYGLENVERKFVDDYRQHSKEKKKLTYLLTSSPPFVNIFLFNAVKAAAIIERRNL